MLQDTNDGFAGPLVMQRRYNAVAWSHPPSSSELIDFMPRNSKRLEATATVRRKDNGAETVSGSDQTKQWEGRLRWWYFKTDTPGFWTLINSVPYIYLKSNNLHLPLNQSMTSNPSHFHVEAPRIVRREGTTVLCLVTILT